MLLRHRLKKLRGEKSQQQFLDDFNARCNVNVKQTRYSAWERGGEPSIDILIKLADYYNVTLDYLTGRVDYSQPEYHQINVDTGLSERAIEGVKLLKARTYNGLNVLPALNFLLEFELDCYENNHPDYPKLSNLLEKVIRSDCTVDEWSAVVKAVQEKAGTSYPQLRDMLKDAAVGHRTERANELLQMLDTWNEIYHDIGFEF